MKQMVSHNALDPVTPGELLNEAFLLPLGLTKYQIAKGIDVPVWRIDDILSGNEAITADMDLRLSQYFGLSTGYWLRLQDKYDRQAER